MIEVGLWIYELTGKLDGKPILLHCALQSANVKLKQSTPVYSVVAKWIDIINQKGHQNTLLVFDSYYFSADTRQLLLSCNTKCCAAVNKEKFPSMIALLGERISQPGDISALYNEKHGEFLLGYWSSNPNVSFFFRKNEQFIDFALFIFIAMLKEGLKYVWSNTITSKGLSQKRTGPTFSIPAYDLFGIGFSICDQFNRYDKVE